MELIMAWGLREVFGEGFFESAFFAWSAALGKILTLYNLRKRNLIVVDWCYMCKQSRETIDYLLFHCKIARS